MPANVDLYAGRLPAWHLEGATRPEGWPDAWAGGLDTGLVGTEYLRIPLEGILPTGEHVAVPDHFAIWRGTVPPTKYRAADSEDLDTPAMMDVVGKNYGLATTNDVLRALMDISDVAVRGDDAWRVETMGLLDKGKRMFVSLRIGQNDAFAKIAGEDTTFYLFVGQRFGQGGLSVSAVPFTVVCANTWYRAEQSKNTLISIPHTSDVNAMLKFTIDVERAVADQKQGAIAWMNALVNRQITPADVRYIIEQTWPDPQKNSKVEMKRAARDTGLIRHTSEAELEAAKQEHQDADKAYEKAMARIRRYRTVAASRFESYLDERGTGFNLYTLGGALGETIERERDGRRGNAAIQLLDPRRTLNQEFGAMMTALNDVLVGQPV